MHVRSDGKFLVTAGWDSRGRVYTTGPKMREVAVLKWHGEGCFGVGFGEVLEADEGVKDGSVDGREMATTVTFRERRKREVEERHWIALGSKDGKISLWDIY